MRPPFLRSGSLPACSCQGGERGQRVLQEPTEPDTLAPTGLADAVHAVIPVSGTEQRQAMLPNLQAVIQSTGAMLEQRSALRRALRLKKRIVLSGLERGAGEKRNGLIEHGHIARRLDVVVRAIGEPDRVIGNASPHTLAEGHEPPMLQVAF